MEEEASNAEVSRSAFRFSFGVLLSRVSGLAREQTTAFFFGTSPLIAAFLVAYRIALSLRRILGEGALLIGFIPHFEVLRSQSEVEAAQFAKDVYGALSLALLLFLFVTESVFFGIWQWAGICAENRELILLIMLILPGLFFICLASLSGALLQCEKKFFLPGISPAIFNLIWVGGVLLMHHLCREQSIIWLALSTVIAFGCQWLFLSPSTLRFFSLQKLSRINLFSPHLKKMLGSLSFSVIGVGAVQINGILGTFFARLASLEGPAYLNFAMRLHQFPLALIGIAVSAALLPSLSRTQDESERLSLLQFGLTRTFVLIVPCTFALFALGLSSICLLYYRGQFHVDSVCNTTLALWQLSLGLLPMSFVMILGQLFYAKKDYVTPVKAALFGIGANCLLNALFVNILHQGTASVAFATSLASGVQLFYLQRQMGPLYNSQMKRSFLKAVIASLLAAAAACILGVSLNDQTLPLCVASVESALLPSSFSAQFVHFALMSSCFLIVFFAAAYMMSLQEFLVLFRRRAHAPLARRNLEDV